MSYEKYYTIFPNLNYLNSTYVAHYRENGEHFDGSLGQDLYILTKSTHILSILQLLAKLKEKESGLPSINLENIPVGSYKKNERNQYRFNWLKEFYKPITLARSYRKDQIVNKSFSIFLSDDIVIDDLTSSLNLPWNSRIEIEIISNSSKNHHRRRTITRQSGEISFVCPDFFEATLSCDGQRLQIHLVQTFFKRYLKLWQGI